MAHLSLQEKLEYTEIFLKVNSEFGQGDGALRIDEFEKFLILCGFKFPKEFVALKFAENDTDGNWKITLDEFLARMPNIIPSGSVMSMAANVRRKYNEFDVTKDGYITFDELKLVMSKKGDVTDEYLRDFVKEWDQDGDGRINFEEFLVMYVKTILFGENRSDITKEDEELAKTLTELVLSSDKIRRLCNDRDMVKAGLVSEDNLRSLMSEVKVQLTDEQFRQCIKELEGDVPGQVRLEDFVNKYEDIIIKETDEAQALKRQLAAEENKEKSDKDGKTEEAGEERSRGEDEGNDVQKEAKSEGNDVQKEETSEGKDVPKEKTGGNSTGVKGMVGKFEKMKV